MPSFKRILFPLFTFICLTLILKAQPLTPEVTFVYWMPYDNNLSNWADSIYSEINSGILSDHVVVTIQKDTRDRKGMTRSIIRHDSIVDETIADEKSYSGLSYFQYLKWVANKVDSKSYVLVFLDHGGKLDEIGLDEWPDREFLTIDSIAWAIDQFNMITGKKVDLIFLQVCAKGSIETLYELKDVTHFTMYSQVLIGAPNYYYAQVLKDLSNGKGSFDGLAIAKSIMQQERDDMYTSLTCINNSKIDAFQSEFKSFIINTSGPNPYTNNNRVLKYNGESFFDLGTFVQCFKGLDSEDLLQSIRDLVVLRQFSNSGSKMKDYSGISILAPGDGNQKEIEQYKHLQFFKEFDMNLIYEIVSRNGSSE